MLYATSSALKSRDGVKLAVLWNLTPRRRLKVYSRPSSVTDQLSAKAGTIFVVPRSNSARRPGTLRQRSGQAYGRYGQTPAGRASAEVPFMK